MANEFKEKIAALLTTRGKTLTLGPTLGMRGCNVILADDADGRGCYIFAWDSDDLGPWPSQADGFTTYELRYRPAA